MKADTRSTIVEVICWIGLGMAIVLWWTGGTDGYYNPFLSVLLLALWVAGMLIWDETGLKK